MTDSFAAIRTFLSEDSENADELFSTKRKIREVSVLNLDFTTNDAYSACKKVDYEANILNKQWLIIND